MTTILNKVIGERGRAKFTVIKYSSTFKFEVESPYFNNNGYIVRFYIWTSTSKDTKHYDDDLYKNNSTSYYLYLQDISRGVLYNFHVYIEKEVNTPVFVDEITFTS